MAIERVTSLGASAHVPAPQLQEGDIAPEDLRADLLFVDDEDVVAPRHLKDVWQGRGDHDDPFQPIQDYISQPEASAYDEELLARRMREDSDASLNKG